MDLTVAAIPAYFASMAAEHRWLRRRADEHGPSAADYTRPDTATSLAMGVGSLVVPLVTHALAERLAVGHGRHARKLVALAVGAAVTTTVADRVAAATAASATSDEGSAAGTPPGTDQPSRARRRSIRRWARRVASVGGVTSMAAATVAAGATYIVHTKPSRVWAGSKRDLGHGPLAWVLAIAGWDFIYYWNHRFMHEVRGLWAIHVVHHSSERYNLSTALRQPVADAFGVFVPYSLMCRMGISPYLVNQARGVNLLYQYWIHTEAIRRMGRAEEVLNTPSHHRVHHGSNAQYLDRNHGSILIVWDRLFGTFEREDERVVYGLTKNVGTFDPIVVATHEHRDIVRDVAASTSWRERLSFFLRGPGWAYERQAQRAALDASAPDADLVAA